MSGPQGYDPTQPWQPQPGQGEEQRGSDQQWQPPVSPEQSSAWQPPAYTPSPYQQPTAGYPPAPQYPATAGQPGQYGQPTQYGQYPQQYGQPGQSGQYGQPTQYGQYPQQYGPPGQYGQYPQQVGPYGQPGPGSKRSTTVITTVAAVFFGIVALVVLVLGFWVPGFFVTTRLDIDKAQTGVQQVLTDQTNGYGAKNVKDVKCNDGENPVVKQGDTFNCEVSIDGTKRQVTVTFQDNSGTYEVGRPK